MEIFRFFISISPILLILSISTGQRFRKGRSVHDTCMGWIIGQIECLNSVWTDSDFYKNSWRYSGFSFPFCWFWGFQRASASRRRGLLMKLVWDALWRASSSWIPSAQILIRTRSHGDIQVFHFHFADFAGFQQASASGKGGLFMMLIWDLF